MSEILERAKLMARGSKPRVDPMQKIKDTMIDICSLDGGVEVFRHIKNVCAFGETPNIMGSVNEVMFILGRQSVYNDLRKYMPKKARERIESLTKEGE